MGQKKYKEFLAVNKMAKRIQKSNLACVEVPMWEISQGPHFDELQKLLESFWLPDLTTADNLILKYDLIVIPDPVLAKYLVEAYYLKESKMAKKKEYYEKLMKQPWGVVDAYPPKERMEWYISHLLFVTLMTDSALTYLFCGIRERVKSLHKQKWIRKFPPLATIGEDTYKRIKNHGQVDDLPV